MVCAAAVHRVCKCEYCSSSALLREVATCLYLTWGPILLLNLLPFVAFQMLLKLFGSAHERWRIAECKLESVVHHLIH
jgi:hypothetical protein